jgi:hypothetical protein
VCILSIFPFFNIINRVRVRVRANSLAVPAAVRTPLSTRGRTMFGSGYENCPEFGVRVKVRARVKVKFRVRFRVKVRVNVNVRVKVKVRVRVRIKVRVRVMVKVKVRVRVH